MAEQDVHCPRCGENLGTFPVELPTDVELEQICGHLTVTVMPQLRCAPGCTHWSHDDPATPYTEQETTEVEERPDDDPAPVATCNGRDCGGRPHE